MSACACGCGETVGGRPNRKYVDGAHRVRYYRAHASRETVTGGAGSAHHGNGVSATTTPTVAMTAFDLAQVEKISLGGDACCTFHLATATEWAHRFPNPYREASYLSDLKRRSYCRKEVTEDGTEKQEAARRR